jgi:hypothetical protein
MTPLVAGKDVGAGVARAGEYARHVAMTWAQRLKRVFKTEIETCEHCGGTVKVIASPSFDKLRTIGNTGSGQAVKSQP